MDNSRLKISDLPEITVVSERGVVPIAISQENAETYKLTLKDLRGSIMFENAFTTVAAGLAATASSELFFVYSDDTKEYVNGWVNVSGVAQVALDNESKPLTYGTWLLLRNAAKTRGTVIQWVYNGGAALGGEITFTAPIDGDLTVQEVYLDGVRQFKNLGFESAGKTFTLPEAVKKNQVVIALLYDSQDIDKSNESLLNLLSSNDGAKTLFTSSGRSVQEEVSASDVNLREQWRRQLTAMGFTLATGSFEEGANVVDAKQALWSRKTGQCYLWTSTDEFPRVVASNTDVTGWMSVGPLVPVTNATRNYALTKTPFLNALNSGNVNHNTDSATDVQLIPTVGKAGRLTSAGNKIESTTKLVGAIRYVSTGASTIMSDVGVIGAELKQQVQAPYSNNNHAMVKFIGVDRPVFAMNYGNVDIPCTLGYGYSTVGTDAQKATQFGVFGLNTFKVGTMGFEILGGAYNSITGNVMNLDGGFQHAYRLAGYQGAPCWNNALVGNISYGGYHAYSFQKTAKGNAVVGFTVYNPTGDAIEFTPIADEPGELENKIAEFNYVGAGVVRGGTKAIYCLGGRKNVFDIIAANQSGDAVTLTKETNGGDGSLNTVRGVVASPGNYGALVSTDYNHLDLTVHAAVSRGVYITGSNNSGRLSVFASASGVTVAGDNNFLFILSKGNTGADLVVSGKNNVIVCNVGTCNITSTGEGNTFYGTITTLTDAGTGNNKANVVGDMLRGRGNFTTDANGFVYIPHAINNTAYLAFASVVGEDGKYAQVSSTSAGQLKVKVFLNGAAVANTSVSINWRVERGLGV